MNDEYDQEDEVERNRLFEELKLWMEQQEILVSGMLYTLAQTKFLSAVDCLHRKVRPDYSVWKKLTSHCCIIVFFSFRDEWTIDKRTQESVAGIDVGVPVDEKEQEVHTGNELMIEFDFGVRSEYAFGIYPSGYCGSQYPDSGAGVGHARIPHNFAVTSNGCQARYPANLPINTDVIQIEYMEIEAGESGNPQVSV
uniref:Uncharacterized protein n=1 Tax=Gibberella zeae TaxID=5518 RepID=A0A4E9EEF1_GIBZA